jgi:hypothetical protein
VIYPDRAAGGVVAAAVAAFLPYRLSHLVHVQVLMVGWLWWAAWSVHRYFAEPGWKAAARIAVFYVLLGMSSLYWAYIGPGAARRSSRQWSAGAGVPHFVPLTSHAGPCGRSRRRGVPASRDEAL